MPRGMSQLSAWRNHLVAYQKSNPGVSLKEAMKKAAATYKKGGSTAAKPKTKRTKKAAPPMM